MAREDYRQGIMWYEVAAQVAHHSLPSSIASTQSTVEASATELALDASEPAALDPAVAADPSRSGSPPHTDALYNLGMVYYDGIVDVVPRDRKRAAQYFRAAGACNAIRYQINVKCVKQHFYCFVFAAALHDSSALFWLGVSHHTGDAESGIWRNRHECLRYLELAAGYGHSGAQFYLSRIFRSGDNGIKVAADKRKADYFLGLAAEQGYPDALFEVGDAHYHGVDGPIDYLKALELYLKAAEAGHVDAMISAGAMYFNGKGVAQDYHRAFELYQSAAEQGSISAWENVAAMHILGQGVPKNPEAASYIHKTIIPALTKAAENEGIQPEATLLDLEGDSGSSASGCGKPTCACKAGASPTDGCA
jgi:TPR repeat protein